MAEDDPDLEDERSMTDLKRQVKSLGEKLEKQQEITRQLQKDQRKKGTKTAILLAAIPGLFGVLGIGHFYAGKKGKGIILLVGGLVIDFLLAGGISTLNVSTLSYNQLQSTWGGLILLGSIYLGLYIFQIFHARHYCGKYNELIEYEDLN